MPDNVTLTLTIGLTTPTKFKVGDYVRDVDTAAIGQVVNVDGNGAEALYFVEYLIGGTTWFGADEAVLWEPRAGETVVFRDSTDAAGKAANVVHYADGVATLHIPAVGVAVASVRAIRPVSANTAAANLRAGDHIQIVDTTGLNRRVRQGDIGVVTLVDGADIRIKLLLSNNSVIDQHCSAGHLRRASVH